MENLINVAGKRLIINRQYSKIGACYPRLFIEVGPDSYLNFDLTLRATFKMESKDFQDWLSDAKELNEEEAKKSLTELGVEYDLFAEAVKKLK